MKKIMYSALLFILMFDLADVFAGNLKTPIPFYRAGHFIIVKARINRSDRKYNFIIDTGALTLIDKSIADDLGLKQRDSMAKIDSMVLSGVKIKKVFCFTGFDVKAFKKYGVPIHGIIGSNLLDRYKVIFDFKSSTITLSEDTTLFGPQVNGILMYFRNHPINNAPLVKFKAGTKIMEGMIDTGQPFPLVFPFSEFTELSKSGVSDTIRSNGIMVKWPMTKPKFNYIARLDSALFGSEKFTDMVCVFGELPPMLSMPLVGMDFLSQFKVIINYPKHQLVLIPDKEIRFDKNIFSFGINLNVSEEGKVFIEGVWQNSTADRAGIKPGQVVMGFNSKKVTSENLIKFWKILRNKDVKSLVLKIQNGNSSKIVKLNKMMLFE